MHFCFPFHHSTSTQRFFKLCLRNQPVEKGSLPLYTFIVHNMQKAEEKKILPHTCITLIYRYMRICPDLVKNSLNKTSFFIQCPCKQNFVFRIKSEKEKPVLKDFIFIRIFVILHAFLCQLVPKRHTHFSKPGNFRCRFVFLLSPGMKGLKAHSQV